MKLTRDNHIRALRRVRRLDWLTFVLAVTAMSAAPACAPVPPVLQSRSVAYRWADPGQGGGLLAIDDLVNGKSLLDAGRESPTWWRVKLKDGQTVSNTDLPCRIAAHGGSLTFTWTGDVRVTVTAGLGDDGALLRARISVEAVKEGVGLRDVVFPVLDGIRPLSSNTADDRLLLARRTGYTSPTPLTTGEAANYRYCIEYYMQFTALLGDGRGLYIGDHDPTAAWKDMSWTPDADTQTLSYAISHPVLDWGSDDPVRRYESPGDCVIGPLEGDWFDIARIYRKWAVTAPWCAKGPMYQRKDYPQWLLNLDYWACGHLGDYYGQQREFIKRDLFDFPNTATHDYGYYGQPYQHDVNVDYFPPRCGSVNYQKINQKLRARGGRVIPYVIGWMWNAGTDSYQLSGAKEKGAMLGEDRDSVLWAELSPAEENIAMCPASQIWRDKLTSVSMEHVKRYRTGGVYFDYFTNHMNDCHNPGHGHAMGGGDYWSRGVRGLYKQVRDTVHEFDPEAMFCGEDPSEFALGVLDAHYTSTFPYDAPVWQAVYHDYTQLFGGTHWMEQAPVPVGRQWLLGHMNSLSGAWGYHKGGALPESAQWQHDLLRCHHEFARPYLGYGQMLRPPVVTGDLPTIKKKGGDGPFTVLAVEGTAWRAHDGSVGIFFFNYEDQPHQFTWKKDVAEIAGFDEATKLQLTQWTVEHGATPVEQINGGIIGGTTDIAPRGIVALKLEVVK
ncbi:MAG: DUF6259 domain-containing protein [Phycisphaeraceae bacterium]|nr:DUF6259 domain-containing protein [Phycisphaeraceae bacterium]